MQTIWWLILFDLRKSSCWWIKAVINIVVITLAYFTNQYRACSWFYFKVMIHSLHDRNAHTWFQFYLCTSRNDLNFSVDMYGNMLGWDITDYGMGDFDKYGFSLFTIRNGNIKMKDKYKKPYADDMVAHPLRSQEIFLLVD